MTDAASTPKEPSAGATAAAAKPQAAAPATPARTAATATVAKPAATAAKPAAPSGPKGSFAVVPEKCVACDACARDFPGIFAMTATPDGGRVAVVKPDAKIDPKLNPRAVVLTCPTDAIVWSGTLPPLAGAPGALLAEVEGWEAQWASRRAESDDPVERERRYGRDYAVEEKEGHVLLTIRFPTRAPPMRERFRYGLPEVLPRYATTTKLEGSRLVVRAWLTDPKVRAALCFGANSFPDRLTVAVDVGKPVYGFQEHYDARQRMEIALFTDPDAEETFRWPAHFITDACTGCTVCARVCPTNAITGEQKVMHYIDPVLCINCSVCGVYCPFDAITGQSDEIVQRIKPREIPKAQVIEELCTGCEFCVHVCPFDCIHLEAPDKDPQNPVKIAVVDEKKCVSCFLCEQVCIKGAIVVPREQEFPEEIGFSYQKGAW